jgi:hypothetical protein
MSLKKPSNFRVSPIFTSTARNTDATRRFLDLFNFGDAKLRLHFPANLPEAHRPPNAQCVALLNAAHARFLVEREPDSANDNLSLAERGIERRNALRNYFRQICRRSTALTHFCFSLKRLQH